MINIPIILSGGSGTRLWPLSRMCHPKQLLEFDGEHSLLQNTLLRIAALDNMAKPIIICNQEHRFTILEQIKEINVEIDTLIIEPVGRNTAASIALAAIYGMEIDSHSRLFIFPSDHHIINNDYFSLIFNELSQSPLYEEIITLGITPTYADPGFGYIKMGKENRNHLYEVEGFTEKPSVQIAEKYIKSGKYLWNSGMFIAQSSTLLKEFELHAETILDACKNALKPATEQGIIELNEQSFLSCPNISFDHAIMEKTDKAQVLPINIGWNDLGNWQRIWESSEKDANNNIIRGDVIASSTKNSYVWTKDHFLLVTIGVDNLVIIQTADVCLIANKNNLDELTPIIEKLKNEQRTELFINKKMYRPWGEYENLTEGQRYQVKRVIVKPGAKLSLQLHCHRSEHWVVVKGTGKVTRGNEELIISENESTYIPYNTKHRIENIGKIDLELVEVQVGSYLGEDDIIRFDDCYGRKQ